MNVQTGIVNIRGKDYQTVALRVQLFREKHPSYSIVTSIVERDSECVVMLASIGDEAGRVIATGYSEEFRKSSQINRTSALENAETSAIGRALANFGIGGTEFASANEVENAIHQQATDRGRHGDNVKEDKVSPTAPDYAFPDGPATGITMLKGMVRELWREVKGCGDADELHCLLETAETKAILAQLDALENPAHREIWTGDGKDNPGLRGVIEQQKLSFNNMMAG